MENGKADLNFYEYKRDASGRDVSLFGAIPEGPHTFYLSAPRSAAVLSVSLAVRADGGADVEDFPCGFFSLSVDRDVFSVSVDPGRGLYYYRWIVRTAEGESSFGGERPTLLEEGADRQLTVYPRGEDRGASFRGGVVYQIFPDRFFRAGGGAPREGATLRSDFSGCPSYPAVEGAPHANSDFFGGDLDGVEAKLDYIASLGVTHIYLNPIFEAASNHRYDTGDLMRVDPLLGGDASFFSLVRAAEKRGIGVLLDGVFDHVGADSVYFNKYGSYPGPGAFGSRGSEYFPWFRFTEYPREYESWWGIDVLPKISTEEESFRRFITGEFLDKWTVPGVAGWRIDVADELSEEFLSDFRRSLASRDPDAVVIGEVWEDASDKISYGKRRGYFTGGLLDSVMNYPLRDALIAYTLTGDASKLRYAAESLYRRYPKSASDLSLNVLGTHDTPRILTVLGGMKEGLTMAEKAEARLTAEERRAAVRRLKAVFSVLTALPGVPSVFYGDEAGVEGYSDPFCRRPFPWGGADGELTAHFRDECAARIKEPVLADGLFEIVFLDENLFAFIRYDEAGGKDALLTVFNRTDREAVFPTRTGDLTVPPTGVVKEVLPPRDAELLRPARPGYPPLLS